MQIFSLMDYLINTISLEYTNVKRIKKQKNIFIIKFKLSLIYKL